MKKVLLIVLLFCQIAYSGVFVNPKAAQIFVPYEYTGQRYESLVPDTYDISERAKLAIKGLTGPLDANDDYLLYWLVNFKNCPPVMLKESYINITAKFQESIALLRLMTGSKFNNNVDVVWMNNILKSIGEDGLLYQKKNKDVPLYSLHGCGIGRLMGAVMIYYQLDGDKKWLDITKNIIDRYRQLAVDKGDWAFFESGNYPPNYKANPNSKVPTGIWSVDGIMGRIVQPLGQYYKLTGYQPAKELGDKLINYLLYHSEFFGADGQWLTDKLDPNLYPGRENDCHFGTHSHTLLYMLDYALCTDNKGLQQYCKKSFEWAINRNSTIEGQSKTATKIGFHLEYLNPYYPTSETCSLADMIAVALKLSASGNSDYWDDADSWIRNHFAENQILYSDWVSRLKSSGWPRKPEVMETDDRVAERNVGCFLSWVTANDGCQSKVMEGDVMHVAPGVSIGIMHCCTGNATRTMYYIWENILEYKDDSLKINLLLNRASKWADMDSYIPYEGKVVLKVKEPLKKVLIRMPEWIKSDVKGVVFKVNDQGRELTWEGRYVNVGSAKAGDTLSLEFPISETVVKRRVYGEPHETMIGGYEYERLIFRGNTLVSIDPAGKNYPLYQRQYYREQPRWIKIERFVPEKLINW